MKTKNKRPPEKRRPPFSRNPNFSQVLLLPPDVSRRRKDDDSRDFRLKSFTPSSTGPVLVSVFYYVDDVQTS